VIEDIQAHLGAELVSQRGPQARESLALTMLETSSQPERMAWLAQVVPGLEGSGVIYVLTVADTTRVASFLRTQGIDAHAYSGETESERRLELGYKVDRAGAGLGPSASPSRAARPRQRRRRSPSARTASTHGGERRPARRSLRQRTTPRRDP
jgi:hypothetical protein